MRFLVALFVVFQIGTLTAQQTGGARVMVNYTPTDFFVEMSCYSRKAKTESYGFMGLGINRTVFQGRFYPEIGIHYAYTPFTSGFRPFVYGQLSFSRLRISNASAHYWVNPEIGIRLDYQKKKPIGITLGYRYMREMWRYDKKGYGSNAFGPVAGIYFGI